MTSRLNRHASRASGWRATALSLALIWAVGAAVLLHVRAGERAQHEEAGRTLVRMAEIQLAETLRAAGRTALTAAMPLAGRLPSHQTQLPASGRAAEASEADLLLRRALQVQGVVRELAWVDSTGTVIAGTAPRPHASPLVQVDPILLVDNGDGPRWRPLEGATLGTARTARDQTEGPGAAAGRPRLVAKAWQMPAGPGHEDRHWLVAAIDTATWSEQLSSLLGDTDWQASVIDGAGRWVAGASASRQGGAPPAGGPLDGVGPDSNRGGADPIRTERPIQGVDHVLRFELPARVVERASASNSVMILTVTLLISVLAIASGAALHRVRQRWISAQQLARQAGERAEASEAELRSLVDSQPEWMFRTDERGVVTFMNRHWQALSGLAPEAALGRPLFELVHPGDAPTVRKLFSRPEGGLELLRSFRAAAVADVRDTAEDLGSAGGSCLVRLITTAGEVRELELSVASIERGPRRGYAGFGVDITERERARRQASAHFRLTEQVIEAIPQPIFLTNAAGDLVMANRAWAEWMVDIPESSLSGGNPAQGSDRSWAPPAVHDMLALGLDSDSLATVQHWPIELPSARGRTREVVLTKVRLQHDGPTASAVIGSLVDVTEFKQAKRATEEALRAAEAAIASRTQFVANVSHELRTPLQSIIGFAELGRDRSVEGSRPQAMFGRIHNSGHRMLKLVEDLLDVSRLGSGVGRFRPEPLPVTPNVREVVDELQSLATSRGLTITYESQPELDGREALIDPLRLGQVVRNVIANAMCAAPAGSAIDVRTQMRDGLAITTVRDHGPGIPSGELESVFEPFVQSSLTRSGSGGTGLGLAICRRIMTTLNGHITADNHPDGGAVFSIGIALLPLAVAETASRPTQPDGASADRSVMVPLAEMVEA